MIRRQTVECTTPSSTHCVKDLLVFLLLRCWTFCLCHFCLKEVLDEMVGTETLSCFCVLYHHISKTIYMSWGSAQCVVCACVYVLHLLSHMHVCTYITTEHAPVYSAHCLRQPPASPGPGSTNMYVCTVCTSAHHIIFIHTCMSMYKCMYMQYIIMWVFIDRASSLQDGCWGHCGCVDLKQALLQYKMLPPQVDNVVLHGTSHWTVVIQASIS